MSILDKSVRRRFNHEALNKEIMFIEKVFHDSNVAINKLSELYNLISNSKELVKAWSAGKYDLEDNILLYNSLHIERISNALRVLEGKSNKNKYLKDILKGTLDFFERNDSPAKSILWELEVCRKLRDVIPDTSLEEPDVVANIADIRIAIPCKKLFSPNGLSKVLSNAVKQIENNYEFGIVALNIDDLVLEKNPLEFLTFNQMADGLHARNLEFMKENERHLKKYLDKSRIIGALVSTAVPVEIVNQTPRFNNASQWTIWTVPHLLPAHDNAITLFRKKLMGK